MSILNLDQVQQALSLFAPAGTPGAPLESTQFMRSLQPSLMPRTSVHQGAASALAILAARGASNRVNVLANRITPNEDSLTQRLITRVALAGAGYALRTLPDNDDTAWPAGVARLSGELMEGAAVGGLIYEVANSMRSRGSSATEVAARNSAATAFALAFGAYKSRSYLSERRDFFTDDFDKLSLTLPKTLAVTAGVTGVGTVMGLGHQATRRGFERFFGPGLVHTGLARTINNAFWAGALTGLYWGGISTIGKSNEKIDPGYAEPPTSPLVSGSAESLSTFEDLGQQGRRFVTDVVTPELIESALGEPATAHPIRVFVGFNSQPLYPSGRSEMALAELERTGAYDRGTILLISPTGTGWVDHTMIEAAEFFTRGDIASVCIQYVRYPSFLSLQKVRQGRQQFRQLVWGVHQRLQGMAPEDRPRVLVFGESLGAWASSDVVMKLGVEGLDHYSIDRALWFGMPQLARWSAAGLYRPGQLTPAGTVGVFDCWDELEQLTPEQRDALRIVQLSHDNDPITLVTPTILYRSPDFLNEPRGRGVPDGQRWYPVVTFLQTMIDAANAMRDSPGNFRSTGHDYRADTARFVAEGYRLPYTEEQLAAVEVELRRLEIERAARMKPPAATEEGHTPAPAQQTEAHHKAHHLPRLRGTRTRGARWFESITKHTPPYPDEIERAERGEPAHDTDATAPAGS
ncbi:MAG: alpha/beta-hydrolase family protein [Microthrixaceae bacterium]